MNELWQKQQESAFKEWQFFYDNRELLENGELTIKELIESSHPVDGENVIITANDDWGLGFIDYDFTISNNKNISYCYYGFAENCMNELWYFLELLTQTTEDLYFACEEEGPESFFYIQNINGEKIRFMHISDRVQQPNGIVVGLFKVHQDFIISKHKLIEQFYNAMRIPIISTKIEELSHPLGTEEFEDLIKDSEIIKNYLNI